ncbi:MAG: hypothetical protein K9I36_14415 [Bacteroidia bacterium]|nr:hypothetical protein [Bacteroidia bacterium]
MKKNYYLIALLLGLGLNQIFAQTYDLNNYKYRFQNYRGLLFSLDLGSNGNLSNISTADSSKKYTTSFKDRTSNQSLNLGGNYFTYTNTANLQRNRNFTFREYSSLSTQNHSTNSTVKWMKNNTRIILDLNYQEETRFYKSELKFNYLSIMATLNQQSSFEKSIYNSDLDYKRREYQTQNQINLKLGLGNGRLENVTDAVQAAFILQDLERKAGTNYTALQLENIAKGITQINNKRYLDFRFKTIEQLTALDSVMQANGINGNKSITYYTTLTDNWLYSNRQLRFSGKRWTYYFNPQTYVINSKTNNKEWDSQLVYSRRNSWDQRYSAFMGVDYDFSTQKSLTVERSYGWSLTGGLAYNSNYYQTYEDSLPAPKDLGDAFGYNSGSLNFKLSAYWQHLYQPNSRNILILRVMPSYTYIQFLDALPNNIYYDKRFTLNPTMNITFRYYKWFSPHLNFTVYNSFFVLGQNDFMEKPQNKSSVSFFQLRNSLTAGFVYQLF